MNPIQQLLEEIESVKNILMARATGERADENKYQRLRYRLTTNALVQDKLPRFVRTCGSLGEFWTHVQDQHRSYAKRRRYITEQFEEVLQKHRTGDETTFEQDINDQDVLRAWLLDLTEQVAWRLRRYELRGRVVHLKVRFADFSMISRSQTLPEPTDITDELWQVVDDMLCQRLPADHLAVRLLGMGVSGFDASGVRQRLLSDQADSVR